MSGKENNSSKYLLVLANVGCSAETEVMIVTVHTGQAREGEIDEP